MSYLQVRNRYGIPPEDEHKYDCSANKLQVTTELIPRFFSFEKSALTEPDNFVLYMPDQSLAEPEMAVRSGVPLEKIVLVNKDVHGMAYLTAKTGFQYSLRKGKSVPQHFACLLSQFPDVFEKRFGTKAKVVRAHTDFCDSALKAAPELQQFVRCMYHESLIVVTVSPWRSKNKRWNDSLIAILTALRSGLRNSVPCWIRPNVHFVGHHHYHNEQTKYPMASFFFQITQASDYSDELADERWEENENCLINCNFENF